jgi:hypothetical protein
MIDGKQRRIIVMKEKLKRGTRKKGKGKGKY